MENSKKQTIDETCREIAGQLLNRKDAYTIFDNESGDWNWPVRTKTRKSLSELDQSSMYAPHIEPPRMFYVEDEGLVIATLDDLPKGDPRENMYYHLRKGLAEILDSKHQAHTRIGFEDISGRNYLTSSKKIESVNREVIDRILDLVVHYRNIATKTLALREGHSLLLGKLHNMLRLYADAEDPRVVDQCLNP